MVKNVDNYRKLVDCIEPCGAVVELVGIAGAGKTTLFTELQKSNCPDLLCGYHPMVWKLSSYPFYIKNVIQLLPLFIRLSLSRERLLTRREIAFLAILNGWGEYLARMIKDKNRTFIVDQGAIFIVSYFQIWGPRSLFGQNMQEWWDTVYKKWSKVLNLIILLDANDELLVSRINTRPQEHLMKGMPDQISTDWLDNYRSVYVEILDKLFSFNPEILVVRIDTGEHSADEITERIVPELLVNSKN